VTLLSISWALAASADFPLRINTAANAKPSGHVLDNKARVFFFIEFISLFSSPDIYFFFLCVSTWRNLLRSCKNYSSMCSSGFRWAPRPIPVRGEEGLGDCTAEALKSRPSTKLRMRGMKKSARGEPVEPCELRVSLVNIPSQ
jgi:hypothetical protein